MKLAAVSFELPEERRTRHSLRSGGATSLFVSGVSLEDTRRFGWWRSVTSHEYLWLGDLQYRHLSSWMANSASLADELRLAADKTRNIKFTEPVYMEAEDMTHRTGCTSPLVMRWRSPGSSPEPRSGDDFPEETVTMADMTVAQRHPGSVALEYLKRPTRAGPDSTATAKRSAEQERASGANFLKLQEKFRQRR